MHRSAIFQNIVHFLEYPVNFPEIRASQYKLRDCRAVLSLPSRGQESVYPASPNRVFLPRRFPLAPGLFLWLNFKFQLITVLFIFGFKHRF